MERFFNGTDQENPKNQERKNGGKKKKRFYFMYMEVRILVYSPSVGNALGLPPSSLRRTHSDGNLPYNLWTI
jgi:hypothetical protein